MDKTKFQEAVNNIANILANIAMVKINGEKSGLTPAESQKLISEFNEILKYTSDLEKEIEQLKAEKAESCKPPKKAEILK